LHNFKTIISFFLWLLGILFVLGLAVKPAFAEVIDRIQIFEAGDEAEIRIRFVTRIQFVRQVMLKNGDVRIYFNLLEIDVSDPRLEWQKRDSPPSNIVSHFAVTYPEIDSSLSISFGKAVDYHIRPGNDGRSISFFTPSIKLSRQLQGGVIATPSQSGPTALLKPAIPLSAAELAANEVEAKQLMYNAGIALNNSSNTEAIAILTRLLGLPPNRQSQAAQYMIGQAYEINREYVKARTNYDLYIKLYPTANNLKQAKESLARVFMPAYEEEKSVPEQLAILNKMTYYGGFSQYFSKGILQTISTTLPSSVVTTSNINDQSQLLSSLDLTGLMRTESTETRFVLRDTFTANFLPGAGDNNFLTAGYMERGASDQSYFYGLGRQTGAAGGLPSRFDGAWLNRNLSSKWRVNGAIGSPVAPPGSNEETKTFAAVSVDLSRLPGQWSGSTYFIGQRVANILDRRAAGVETHYFDSQSNHMGLFEYDTLFKKLNIGLIQGNWTTRAGANYTFLIDHRRYLQITNALRLEPPAQTIAEMLNSGVTKDTLLENSLAASPITNQVMVGMTQPISTRLKWGGDIRVTNTSSYESYDILQSSRVTFPRLWAHVYSAQLAGNNLFFNNDLGVASASFTNAGTFNGRELSFSQVATFRQKLQINISLRLYAENNNIGVNLTSINPSFRLGYHMNQSMNFEVGAGLLLTHTNGPIQDDKARRRYFNLGYRWDF